VNLSGKEENDLPVVFSSEGDVILLAPHPNIVWVVRHIRVNPSPNHRNDLERGNLGIKRKIEFLLHNRHYPNTLHSPCRYSSDPRKRESAVIHAGMYYAPLEL
jgi:hypothetical protein